MIEIEKLQQKLGEALGLEMAAQKAVEDLGSKRLLNKSGMLTQLQKMREQAGDHQSKLEQIVDNLVESETHVNSTKIYQIAEHTAEKCFKIMQTYLGDDPDSSEAIEFLCLAESGEVTHYEVLNAMSRKAKNKKLSTRVNIILREEKRHLLLCTRLAKRIASA
jgi:ferritin-like metal-binding protein YciE